MKKLFPLAVLIMGGVLGSIFLGDYITLDSLRDNYANLLSYRQDHLLLVSVSFLFVYFVIVSFSLPGAAVASMVGGFLFGLGLGTLLNVTAATLGAVTIFMAVRFGFGASLAARIDESDGVVARLFRGLRTHEISMLLILRLVPIVPFFFANIAPAIVGVRTINFAWTTLVGILPGGLVYTWVGVGLGEILENGGDPDFSIIWSPNVLGPLLGLAALTALPVLLKKGSSDEV
jgi:uncharacterized membrane protein YdjX (TVP38/TMEM64 family)